MATENVFVKAKRYQKSHPRTSWQDCIKACSGKKKAAKKKSSTVGRVKRRKKAAAPKKVKIKLNKKGAASVTVGKARKKTKKRSLTFSLSGVSMTKLDQELRHCESLQENLAKHRSMLKEKGQTPGEKNDIRRDIRKISAAISSSKKHIAALKRSI